ncbi:MAG: tRNA 2-selenouridine(34) synthase MnmH [Bacteroidota bacterium]
MADLVQIERFIELSSSIPLIDVRAPSEYIQGHIPGAINIPLFDDEERKEVGTTYKQVNKEAAMYLGLEYAGKKLVKLAKEGEKQAGRNKTLGVHCWRGGMRSKSMVWLFETLGLTCYLLEGGYKAYRRFVHEVLERPMKLNVVGGRTGSGKTDILHELERKGEQVVDLEGIAHHKGSAFGSLGEEEQPSTEQFENNLCQRFISLNPEHITWIEDESRNIGKCVLPGGLYERMRESKIIFLDISRELRARHLVTHYASYEAESLKSSILKIRKKLGGDRTREALDSIDRQDYFNTAMITLQYYDKAYMHSLERNHKSYHILSSDVVNPPVNADLLLSHFQEGT